MIGYGKGSAAYEAGRPDYPHEIGDWLQSVVGLASGQTVLDLGAGTGKFLKMLEGTGARTIAVEPVPAMIEKLRADHPETEILKATATTLPLVDDTVDAIATSPGCAPLWRENAMIWEAASPYLYARATADGRIIAGGED